MARLTFKQHLIILLLLLATVYLFYGYADMYKTRPHSIHQWRQTDCLSITKNYYEEGMHFFSPKVHWQGDGDGKAVSELPVMNYSVAILWKIFGEKEYLYRFLELFIYSLSLLFMFRMIYELSGTYFYAYGVTLFIMGSPLLAYYSFSFLADVPALSFSMISFSAFVFFIKHRRMAWFYIALAFAVLASLLKASSASVLVIIGLISLFDLLNVRMRADRIPLFSKKIIPWILFPACGLLIITWYRHAIAYNHDNSDGVFLMGFLPIWKMEHAKVIETLRALTHEIIDISFHKAGLFLLLGLLIWLLTNLTKLEPFMRVALIVSMLFFSLFILLFFKVFDVHDYYLITQIIFPVIILAAFGAYLKQGPYLLSTAAKMVTLVLVGYSLYYAKGIFNMRTFEVKEKEEQTLVASNDDVKFWEWFHWNYGNTYKPLEEITPYLRSLGIQRTDRVISIPDPSFNVTLYLMDQKGFTGMGVQSYGDTTFIPNDISKGAKYLIINNPDIKKEKGVEPYLKNKVGQFKQVEIYKLESL